MAYAGHVFTNRLLEAMGGSKNVIENTFVENNLTKAPFFSTPVSLFLSFCWNLPIFSSL
jgi:malate dehydrogenase